MTATTFFAPVLLALSWAAADATPAFGTPGLSFSATLGSGMVLQHPATVWGTAPPGATVTTVVASSSGPGNRVTGRNAAEEVAPVTLTTTADATGLWRQILPNRSQFAGLASFDITSRVASGDTSVLRGVLFGRVIMCSGQSNIETVTVDRALNSTAELAAASLFPHVRIFRAAHDSPTDAVQDLRVAPILPWSEANASNLHEFSATCWFVARDLFTQLGGTVPVGVVQAAVGGTAIRNWVPLEALAACPQPYNSPNKYGTGPYMHSVLYNGMVHPFSTGPATFSFVLWDQAESDSYPQTPLGYYGCQTVAHINSWRRVFDAPSLPWIFVHLQPYSPDAPDLEYLRAMQLQALGLPQTGYATAIDLGDATSPLGIVHFQNKQVVSRRATAVALRLAFGRPRSSDGDGAYPPPSFINQSVLTTTTKMLVNVSFASRDSAAFQLKFGATVDEKNQSSAVCPTSPVVMNCTAFEILTNDSVWHPATAAISGDGRSLVLEAPASAAAYAVGSRYAWSYWPLATLFAANLDGSNGLPILPWQQALTMAAPTGAPLWR